MENTQPESKLSQNIPIPPPPPPPPVTPDISPVNVTPNLTMDGTSANRLAVFMIVGVFVLMLIAGLLIAMGPFKKAQKDNENGDTVAKMEGEKNPRIVPKTQDTKVTTDTNTNTNTNTNTIVVNPKESTPSLDSQSSAVSVSLSADNLAFDVDGDGKLTLKDILAVAGFVDSQQYSALYDFDSNARVDVLDLAEIRSEFVGYPVAEYDVNSDGKLNVTDVLAVSGFVDSQQYSALYDFNSDARIDVKDLALIRTAVATAGTVGGN